ncbi:MAG TPA: c-type cytochrome [Methylomirabilota bacterium]|nr:c-type cytochrome [Methylomirabilota bacterium]
MLTKRVLRSAFSPLAALALLSSAQATEQMTTRGAAVMNACAACHGPGGHSQGVIPSIDAMPKESFKAALQAFRSDERQGTVMNRIAKGLDDADIEALTAFLFSSPR